MNFIEDNLYHVYNQGNNKQQIFFQQEDYLIFLRKIMVLILPHSDIIAWCLMPNHFHFLVYTDERVNKRLKQGGLLLDPVTNGIRKLLSSYARSMNNKCGTTGSLFRQKTKSICLSEMNIAQEPFVTANDYYSNCFNYIHQNPVRAKLVGRMEDWEYSSFRDYAGLSRNTICNKDLAARYCSYQKENFIETSYQLLPEISLPV